MMMMMMSVIKVRQIFQRYVNNIFSIITPERLIEQHVKSLQSITIYIFQCSIIITLHSTYTAKILLDIQPEIII
jgi:hypothetical protein